MLHAILHGKAGRIEQNGESLRWRDLFKGSEDLLTAAILGRLPHLSDQALHAFLYFLLGEEAVNLTEFQRIELWPKLESLEGRRYVEPDVLLHFENALVVIEIKPPFGGNQYKEQWIAQVNAIIHEEELEQYENRLYYVALGNVPVTPLTHPELPQRFVQMTLREWEPLRRYLQTTPEFESCRQDHAIRDEWIQAFELFGMAPIAPDWTSLLTYVQQIHLDPYQLPPKASLPATTPTSWEELFNYAGTLNLSQTDAHF